NFKICCLIGMDLCTSLLSADSPFTLTNRATGFCLVKKLTRCLDIRWTSGNRLFVTSTKKCLGAQGKSVGSEVNLYDCDDRSPLQKWECRNETLLTLKGQQYYIKVQEDESVVLSKTVDQQNYLTITGTNSGPCTRTYRELYTIDGNAFGKPCVFPFQYKDRWFGDCTTFDSSIKRAWCAVETKFERELWGYCPTTDTWTRNLATGAYYQVNAASALTWSQADVSCKQQTASLLSITDPNEQAFVSVILGSGKSKFWIGLVLDPDHGWQWTNGRPFRYLRWSAGNPMPNPGHNCAVLDSTGQQTWETSTCGRKQGYICYKEGSPPPPVQIEEGFCANPWIPYNGHCFHLQRTVQTWTDAQRECRKEGGDLVSIRNVEDQSFIISQLGYGPTDELWIGFNDRRTEGLFDWSDHSTVSFTSWEYGKPTVSSDVEDCVLIRGENGNWADRSCDERHGYICMKQSSTERTGDEVDVDVGCRPMWKRHGSYCYFIGTETKTFDDAKEDCKSSGSYLADVANGVDNAFLVSLVGMRPEKYFWLGLSNQKNLDEFVWTNTDTVRFTHWNSEMPGYQQGCVAMTTGILAGLWDLLPCTNTEKYICKHLAEGAVLTPVPPTVTPPKCAEDWNRIGTRNYCSKVKKEKTWFEARDYCRAIGGDLLSIHNSAELRVGRHGRAWIGLHIPDPNSGYAWSDGTPVNFQHWQEGEPNNFNNAENCVEFRIYNWDESGSWNDVNCESYNDWLCQIRAGNVADSIPYETTDDGWIKWGGNQYYINRYSMAMEDARQYCRNRHGDLVSFTSEAENVFVWKQISRNYGYYYIGMSVDLDGSFWWLDGSSVELTRWDVDQPKTDTFDDNCVVMTYYMGFWSSSNCGQEYQSICKRSGSAPVNTTVAPTVAPKGGCPIKWRKFGSKCYNIITNRKTSWEEARKQCITMGGNLVSIPNRQVQAFLITRMAEMANSDLWIGLHSIRKDEFFWTDGKPRKYTNWGYAVRTHTDHFLILSTLKLNLQYHTSVPHQEDCVLMTSNPTFGFGKWLIKPCNDTNGFVCLRDLDPSIPSQPDPIIPNTYVTLGNHSIKIVTQNLTWADAKKRCENDQANLASLRNEWTQAYAELMSVTLKAPLWIGLNKDQTGGFFRYVDGWHLNFANWAEGEPKQNKPCVYLDLNGKWRTAFCNQTMNSVCIQSTEVPPTESSSYPGICPADTDVEYHQSYSWLPFKSHCYLFVTEEIEWADAASSCVRHGGTLASIEDPSEQEFIKSNVEVYQDSHSSFWIGLFKTHKGTWSWLDKTVLDYTNWAEIEPNNDYGEISTSDGTWGTGRRWHDRAYICETPKGKVITTGPQDRQNRAHASLVVVLVIMVISCLIVVAIFIYKKAPRPLPTFENPLYVENERPQPDVVDTNKLIEKAEEETPEPIITL
uniref:Macrophage mannose receptor 1-like n=1 Tax=Sphaeramia orbicularis TaxID=375764 RepID=A0A673AFI2_9TELE